MLARLQRAARPGHVRAVAAGLQQGRLASSSLAQPPPAFVKTVPPGDDKERDMCPQCNRIVYSNPLPVGGAVVHDADPATGEPRVLLLRRDIEPRKGFWTLPGGFLENGESVADGSAREALEEANADVEVTGLHAVHSVPGRSLIMLWFKARFRQPTPPPGQEDTRFSAGHETAEARLFTQSQLPWDELAFPVGRLALQQFFADPSSDAVRYCEVDATEGDTAKGRA
ncbi:hypothetical protein FNF27_06027 [Cafeteria roenbergensis]|uniref:Nudix hydrolase domain-containing protein n=2 Tax=Cafeteria roenbergensis TaxID=33653 RepID=A0A5A8E5X9_CAFRO|nr:hypothetical protein FNF27_06027 [Cafeteria roenbergensis]